MGFNHLPAGFQSAAAMVNAFKASEDNQVLGRLLPGRRSARRCLRNRGLAGLRARLRRPALLADQYDVKLAQQYHRFSTGSVPDLSVRTAQAALLLLGYEPGKIDGIVGNRTRAAVRQFRITAELSDGDTLDEATLEALHTAAGFSLDDN